MLSKKIKREKIKIKNNLTFFKMNYDVNNTYTFFFNFLKILKIFKK